MQSESEANHAAITAWINGSLTPAQRQEFEAHLATCPDCQAQVTVMLKAKLTENKIDAGVSNKPAAAQPAPRRRSRVLWFVLIAAVVILAMGYVLGWWVWDLANG
jgi:anti-sigma factor RsiW